MKVNDISYIVAGSNVIDNVFYVVLSIRKLKARNMYALTKSNEFKGLKDGADSESNLVGIKQNNTEYRFKCSVELILCDFDSDRVTFKMEYSGSQPRHHIPYN